MEQPNLIPNLPGISRLLAGQWAETLRQTACLEVLLENQTRLLAHFTGQEPSALLQQSQQQVEVVLHRLLHQYGHSEVLTAPRPTEPTAVASSDPRLHPLSDDAIEKMA